MPLTLGMTEDIAFMICIGCPGEAGIHQTAYLIRKQLICEGMPEEYLKASWGRPSRINTHVSLGKRIDQYVFGKSSYVYVEEEKVTSWSVYY